ncbi:MAG: hypothetical protein M3N98_00215 [Actinomycetota bacterium]|nr:hypothetical protein [Actinomycetota bacterium]
MKREPQRRSRLKILVAATVIGWSVIPSAVTVPAAAAPAVGSDVSWPQCGGALPAYPGFGIVGVNDGRPFTNNPCLASEYHWAAAAGRPGFYLNTANPGGAGSAIDWYGQRSPRPSCSPADEAACAYNFGFQGAVQAFSYANTQAAAGPGHTWWLDVETSNSWSNDRVSNLASISGAIDALRIRGVLVGVYSTGYQWGRITGGARRPDLPNWVPGAGSLGEAAARCTGRYSFSGGPVVVTQFLNESVDFDYDYACPGSDAVLRPPLPPPASGLDGLVNGLLTLLGLAPPTANGG